MPVFSADNLKALLFGLSLRLYVNDLTPKRDTPYSAFEELEFGAGGYIPGRLRSWSIDGDRATHTPETFIFRDPVGKLFGYFVTRDDATVAWAHRFVEPIDVRLPGTRIIITPKLKI